MGKSFKRKSTLEKCWEEISAKVRNPWALTYKLKMMCNTENALWRCFTANLFAKQMQTAVCSNENAKAAHVEKAFLPRKLSCRENSVVYAILFACQWRILARLLYKPMKLEEEADWKLRACCMDKIPVVLRHASWSRDGRGLGWRYFVIRDKGGAWWNRFPWAKQIKAKRVVATMQLCETIVMIQELVM